MYGRWAVWTIPGLLTESMSTRKPEAQALFLNGRTANGSLTLAYPMLRACRPRRRLYQSMSRPFLLAAVMLASAAASPALAASSESLGTDVAIALPVIAGGITLYKNDWMGAAQLTMDTVATVGMAYGLKHVIRE